ncbi:MAG: formylglycine-generating enzyme family protein [Treponema sp.]|jgi:formylglycine-generating enzyme required for sulfatase activity|nr:formylglycine-generating enzyme family protein [Treponema sp.]
MAKLKSTVNSAVPALFVLCAVLCGCALIACGSSPPAAPGTPAKKAAPEIPEMVLVKGGTFTMGSPAEETNSFHDERPQHEVTLTNFYMSKHQITQKDWKDIMGTSPSNFTGDELPVEKVSWYDTLVFCNKLSMKRGLNPAYRISGSTDPEEWGAIPVYPSSNAEWDAVEIVKEANGYRLPTEAQWEYACRVGTLTPFGTGENITADQANYDGRYPYKNYPQGAYRQTTTPVGSYEPNAWGLYDMHGNVWEWCWDWHGSYAGGKQTDPQGAVTGAYRVARGGSWNNNGRFLRSASRGSSAPAFRDTIIGLRIVRP